MAAACRLEPGDDPWKTDIVLTWLDPDGAIAGSICLPNTYVTDHYRKLFVTRCGAIIQMQTTDDGVRFIRWQPPPQAERGGTR